jgi:hypothetical protein
VAWIQTTGLVPGSVVATLLLAVVSAEPADGTTEAKNASGLELADAVPLAVP